MTKKVLIAEDQPDSRQLLADIMEHFQPYGVSVFVARDGTEAYDIALKERPNLILLDIMMPGMSGYDICKRIKEDPEMSDTYIIVISARFQPEDRTQAALAGADEYVTKPYDVSLIMERVQSVLDIRPL